LNYNLADMNYNVWLNQAEIPASVRPNLTDVNSDGFITFSDLNNSVNQGSGKIVDTNHDGVITGADVLASTGAGGWASGSTQDGATGNPDDLIGWNYAAPGAGGITGTNNPMDDNGHGTFTAGEIAAVGNNALGVTGVEWNAQLMPVKFLDSSGKSTDTAASAAIHYAVDHGAKVINASWGGGGTDDVIQAALQYAGQHGVIVVCAAGNSGTNDDNASSFFAPASYSLQDPNVISVAAIDSNGGMASFSNYGVNSVQLAAPGVNVYSLTSGGSDGTLSGTSMAAPLVTGTVALVWSAHPTWSMSQVINAVLNHTTPDPNLVGKVGTGGIVNAAAAVANTSTNQAPTLGAIPDQTMSSSQGTLTITLAASDPDGDSLTYSASVESMAYHLDQTLGLYSGGDYFYNWGGRQEKWLQGNGGVWYFILPSGAFYQWGGGGATGTLLAQLNPSYYNDPTTLTAARSEAEAYVLAQTLGLYSGGDYYYNWGGAQDKWLQGSGGAWYFLLPSGAFYHWNGGAGASGTLVATVDPSYWANPYDLWHAPISWSVTGNTLALAPAAGYVGSFWVTATVADGHGGTASQSFMLTVTS
jgi:hypothetical protein